MSKVFAVIGAGYGDEGKGLMTDYYSSLYDDAIVIRSNGGAQAGHTVTTPEGERHVFSHFGSGSLNGTPTFLSKHFVCNPTLFKKEHELFVKKFGITPKIYVDGGSLVSTPFDMLLNQTHESMRGNDVHGSCGVGFGETIERALIHDSIFMVDIAYYLGGGQGEESELVDALLDIADEYVPKRIDLEEVGDDFKLILNSIDLINDYIDDCRYMLEHVSFTNLHAFKDNTLIFEGAQGLLLDMDYGFFPHVTRSNCGMKNISKMLKDIWEEHDITANYVTRAYTTRHGAGPLAREHIKLKHNIVDETNITNEFQGSLRFAPFDVATFNSVTDKDFLNYAPRGSKQIVTMTCMDQLDDTVPVHTGDQHEVHEVTKQNFEAAMKKQVQYLSYGPTRDTIIKTT